MGGLDSAPCHPPTACGPKTWRRRATGAPAATCSALRSVRTRRSIALPAADPAPARGVGGGRGHAPGIDARPAETGLCCSDKFSPPPNFWDILSVGIACTGDAKASPHSSLRASDSTEFASDGRPTAPRHAAGRMQGRGAGAGLTKNLFGRRSCHKGEQLGLEERLGQTWHPPVPTPGGISA